MRTTVVCAVALALIAASVADNTYTCTNVQYTTSTGICNGNAYDLSGLTPPTGPKYFKEPQDTFFYYFQPTSPGLSKVAFDSCTYDNPPTFAPAAAQFSNVENVCVYLGLLWQQSWTLTVPNNIRNQYITMAFGGGESATGGERSTVVKVFCDCTDSQHDMIVEPEDPPLQYNFVLHSRSACDPDGCSGPSPPSPSPSPSPSPPGSGSSSSKDPQVGWILVGLFIGLLFVYFVGFALFNKYHLHKEGRDIVPHVDFWTSLPGYVKDGFYFTVAKARRQEYQPI